MVAGAHAATTNSSENVQGNGGPQDRSASLEAVGSGKELAAGLLYNRLQYRLLDSVCALGPAKLAFPRHGGTYDCARL